MAPGWEEKKGVNSGSTQGETACIRGSTQGNLAGEKAERKVNLHNFAHS